RARLLELGLRARLRDLFLRLRPHRGDARFLGPALGVAALGGELALLFLARRRLALLRGVDARARGGRFEARGRNRQRRRAARRFGTGAVEAPPARGNRDAGEEERGERIGHAAARPPRALHALHAGLHAVDADRPVDVLVALLAHLVEAEVELARDLVVDARGDADAAGLGDALQARRDVHAVAEQIVALHHHVAQVDADAECEPLLLGQRFVAGLQRRLDLDRTAQRLHRARELLEHGVDRR